MFQTVENQRLEQRARIAADLATLFAELSAPAQKQKFELRKVVHALCQGGLSSKSGREGEVCTAAAIAQGGDHNPRAPVIPWGALIGQRDLTASLPSAGGRLVGAARGGVMDVLRPWSVAARLGITVEENQVQNLIIPSVTTGTTGQWLATENSAITATQPVTGIVASAPKTFGAMVVASLLFMRQTSTMGEGFLRQQLLGACAGGLDRAIFQGTGSSGQPTGLLYAPGLQSVTTDIDANDFDADQVCSMEAAVSYPDLDLSVQVNDDNLAWVAHPAMRAILRRTQAETWASGSLWSDKKILDTPAHASVHCPVNSVFLGDWSQCLLAIWGAGPVLEVDPYTNFKDGRVSVRVLLHGDVNFTKPKAFARWKWGT